MGVFRMKMRTPVRAEGRAAHRRADRREAISPGTPVNTQIALQKREPLAPFFALAQDLRQL